jgi:hypothetical protein
MPYTGKQKPIPFWIKVGLGLLIIAFMSAIAEHDRPYIWQWHLSHAERHWRVKDDDTAQPIPQNKEAADKAAAEIRRVGLKQYLYGVSVRFCTTMASMVRADERAAYFSECLPDTIKDCREIYAQRGFC